MALDENGLVIKRYTDIVDELNSTLKAAVGSEVDTTENSLIGHMHSNFALALSQVWELARDVYNSRDVYNAEGASLENVASWAGLTRRAPTYTSGTAYFTGDDGTNIPSGSKMSSVRGDEYQTDTQFSISSLSCVNTDVFVSIVVPNTIYSITIDDATYTYTSDADPTRAEILTGLDTVLQADGSVTTTLDLTGGNDALYHLNIDRDDKTSTMSVSGISYLTYENVVTPSSISSIAFGPVPGDALAINTIITGTTGWDSVYNPSDLTLGDFIETDTELRTRIFTNYRTVGSATLDSIFSAVKAVDNVAAVHIRENSGLVTDADLVPAKSYEVIVHEGLNDDIARVLWATKPAGIYMHGTTQVTVNDVNGYEQTVRFSRPDEKYVFIDVRYTPYTEEELPAGAEDNAKLAMLQVADDTLSIGDDIIAKRFLGSIYGATTGFGDVTIMVAYKDNPLDIPAYPGDYADVLTIDNDQISSFATDRMFFTQV